MAFLKRKYLSKINAQENTEISNKHTMTNLTAKLAEAIYEKICDINIP